MYEKPHPVLSDIPLLIKERGGEATALGGFPDSPASGEVP